MFTVRKSRVLFDWSDRTVLVNRCVVITVNSDMNLVLVHIRVH